ncbi:hypothetical protein AB4Y32_32745 [Paraburkholderia phymatum]|uniref:Uncharacterized protein n=1 Tax=Paraburkholderia phymatum TaxID=148447 RepID=A0ACC6UA17_9BURK
MLSEKARGGISVHVLLDWVGSQKMDKRYPRMLEEAGAELIQFHKPHWTGLGRMNDPTHRKLLVIDGRIRFTGGAGIAQEWTGRDALEANLNLYLYDEAFARRQTQIFADDLAKSKRVTLDDWKRRPWMEIVVDRVRVVSLLDPQL